MLEREFFKNLIEMTNTLAHYVTKLIMILKSFIVKLPVPKVSVLVYDNWVDNRRFRALKESNLGEDKTNIKLFIVLLVMWDPSMNELWPA